MGGIVSGTKITISHSGTSGSTYNGAFKNYTPHGFGVLLMDEDVETRSRYRKYTGSWVEGKRTGFGQEP